jgi:hypothetical protein
MRLIRTLVVGAVALAIVPTSLSGQGQWRRADTPNFIVIGAASAGELKDVALRFEGFRETLARVLGPRAVGTAVPTVVAVFPGDHAIAPFRPKRNGKPVDVAGVFVPGRDVNYIAFVNDDNRQRHQILFHEYTHLVTANAGQPVPLWLKEGLAEYYSTFEILAGGKEGILGGLIEHHLSRLNDTVLMTLPELLAVDHQSPHYNEGSRRSVFYAQSWAVVHMMLLGEPSRAPQLAAYVEQVSAGTETMTAWQDAFGALNMEQELGRYIQKRDFRALKYKFGEALTKLEPVVKSVPPADVQAVLADLQLQLQDHEAAAARLDQAATLDPRNERVKIGAVRLALARNQPPSATTVSWQDLSASGDWFLAYMAGVTLAQQVGRNASPSAEDLDAGRRFLAASAAGRDEFPNAAARIAELELRSDAGPTAETGAALERARQRAPGRPDYAFLLAQLFARRAEYEKARFVLGPLMTPRNPPAVRDAARGLMGRIADLELRRQPASRADVGPSLPPPPSGTGPSTTSGGDPTVTSTSTLPSSGGTQPVFRTLKAGEQRFEATLERVECVSGKGITFHLKERGAPVTVGAAAFTDVDLITYRRDLTGSLGCGPLETPMAVYVTWRPGPGAGTRIAVAIEFLPAGG